MVVVVPAHSVPVGPTAGPRASPRSVSGAHPAAVRVVASIGVVPRVLVMRAVRHRVVSVVVSVSVLSVH